MDLLLSQLLTLDQHLLLLLNRGFHSEPLDHLALAISRSENWWLVGLLAMTYGLIRHRQTWLTIALTILVSVALTDVVAAQVLKPAFARVRPCAPGGFSETRVVVGCGSLYGFPSNHAANGAAITATVFALGFRRSAAVLSVLALLVGLSRPYLGLHYPGDVLGGFVTGGILGWLATKSVKRWGARLFRSRTLL